MNNLEAGDSGVDEQQYPKDQSGAVDLGEYRLIENVKVTLVAELDRGTISMQELLRIDVGDILPFSRPIGENIDLFAADVLIGNAEILAVNDKLAVRVADVNKRMTASQAKKQSFLKSGSALAPKIRRLTNGA